MSTQSRVFPGKGKWRLLLVEDSSLDARLFAQLLKSATSQVPFEIKHAGTLEGAMRELGSGDFDVAALDLNLPDSTGLGTFSRLQEAAPDLPIVIVTGSDDEQMGRSAVEAGAQDYVIKNCENYREVLVRSLKYAIYRRRAEFLQVQAEVDRKRSELFSIRQDFLAALTHNLKIRVVGADLVLNALGKLGGLTKAQEDLLTKLKGNSKDLLAMISELIEIYQYETDVGKITPRPVDLGKLARSRVAEFSTLAGVKNVNLSVEGGGDFEVLCDYKGVCRVLDNLLDNAIKFADCPGNVTVRIRKEERAALIEVHNDGPVIPPEEQAVMFRRFWRGVEGRKHPATTGLGLYLCRAIVDAHQGDISCASKNGEGTVFTVTLPLARPRGELQPGA